MLPFTVVLPNSIYINPQNGRGRHGGAPPTKGTHSGGCPEKKLWFFHVGFGIILFLTAREFVFFTID
jgi:hypothetical protein